MDERLKPPKTAAPPDFAAFIATDNKGRTNDTISRKLAELVEAVQNVGKGGEITIKVKVQPWAKNDTDMVRVTTAVGSKVPVEEPPASRWFMGPNGHLLKDNPSNEALPGFSFAETEENEK
jgi:hypothetical protein